ncbi:MAG TPA: lamin tail domain-containing protein, partial [Candidatus Limnocylindria bacterium]|nr:lamin tail domain-containing protein [Candidatus Limnocylindria bacterium]
MRCLFARRSSSARSWANVTLLFLAGLVAGLLPARAQASTLVSTGAVWKYHDQNIDLGIAWRDLNYDDSAWLGGPGPLGGGDPHIATTVNYGPAAARIPTVYYRKTFVVNSASAFQNLTVRLLRDDGAIIFLNGNLLLADGANAGALHAEFALQTVDLANETTYFETTHSTAGLVDGTNILAVASKQVAASSSDLGFDLELLGTIDNTPPTLVNQDPPPGSVQTELSFVTVTFNKPVQGVNAADLLINNQPATNVVVINPREFTFRFPPPATGVVQIAWAPGHGIVDTTPLMNAFVAQGWNYTLDPNASILPIAVISEFLADNGSGVRDEDGTRSDWIELFNSGTVEVNLDGWFLTDNFAAPTFWRFPAVVVQPGKYLLVWASDKNRVNPLAPLHTNFKLAKTAGGYLALLNAETNVVSVFTNYPAQTTDISYGRDRLDPNLVGYFTTPTPGAQNSTSGSGFVAEPTASVPSGVYTNASITVSLVVPPNSTVRYTMDGSVPTNSSAIYSAPFMFSTNTILKARAFPNSGSLFPSAVAGRNYLFLDDTTRNFTSRLPILIMSTGGRAIP